MSKLRPLCTLHFPLRTPTLPLALCTLHFFFGAALALSVSPERVAEGRERILGELRKVIVGQDDVVEQVLIALFTGGHCLITGVPGLATTLLIKTISDIL